MKIDKIKQIIKLKNIKMKIKQLHILKIWKKLTSKLLDILIDNGVVYQVDGDVYHENKLEVYVPWRGYIVLTYRWKNIKVHVDIAVSTMKELSGHINLYGPLKKAYTAGQEICCFEGSHKRLLERYGPTYMTPQKCYSYGDNVHICPGIAEWRKKWGKTSFQPEHSDLKFWEKVNPKYKPVSGKPPDGFNEA